jgi:hypothetical protein
VSQNSTALNDFLCPYNPSAWTAQKTQLFYYCVNSSPQKRTQLFHSNSSVHHISYHGNSCIVACEHYLATVVFLAPEFLLWAHMPQYITYMISS